jgi:hypothetical protein
MRLLVRDGVRQRGRRHEAVEVGLAVHGKEAAELQVIENQARGQGLRAPARDGESRLETERGPTRA